MKIYDYVIVGGGVCGCSTAFELHKYTSNILLIDKLDDVAKGASGAAGAFLSPLLGKPNSFKDLVTDSLPYTVNFYKQNTPDMIDNCGTIRIPKDSIDEEKFQSYIPFIDFPFEKREAGYFFPIGSVVNSYGICKTLTKEIEKKLNYEVNSIQYDGQFWNINGEITTKNLILSTGANIKLIEENYIDIRAVWGQRIDIETSTCVSVNYHKGCSVSKSISLNETTNILSIGATHHRFVEERDTSDEDTNELLKKASEIIYLEDVKVTKLYGGARASSSDYFPIVGEVIDSQKTLEEFPYLKNGTNVHPSRFTKHKNLFILNGVGGRGFVLAPYLAKRLVEHIINNEPLEENIKSNRLFKRWVKNYKTKPQTNNII